MSVLVYDKGNIMKLFTCIKTSIVSRIDSEIESFANDIHEIIEQVKLDVDNNIREALAEIPFSGVKSN